MIYCNIHVEGLSVNSLFTQFIYRDVSKTHVFLWLKITVAQIINHKVPIKPPQNGFYICFDKRQFFLEHYRVCQMSKLKEKQTILDTS